MIDPYEYGRMIREQLPLPNRAMAPFTYFGGKGNLATWIIQHLPRGKLYCEPFCGAASVFWHLDPPFEIEVLNDLNSEIINFFRVLQDRDKFKELAHRLTWTPYSLDEFRRALSTPKDASDLDRAWAFFVRQNQGFSGCAISEGNWSRVLTRSGRNIAATTNKWRGRLRLLEYWHERLMRVQLDNRDAIQVIEYWDTKDTVFYLDPPYIHDTRKLTNKYTNEMTDDEHRELVNTLLNIQGQAVLSGYEHDIYRPLEQSGWIKIDRETACHAAGKVRGSKLRGKGAAMKHAKRTEVLWIRRHEKIGLFE